MLAKELTKEHDGKEFRVLDTGIVFRCDGSVVGEDAVLIREEPCYTWTFAADTRLEML